MSVIESECERVRLSVCEIECVSVSVRVSECD